MDGIEEECNRRHPAIHDGGDTSALEGMEGGWGEGLSVLCRSLKRLGKCPGVGI